MPRSLTVLTVTFLLSLPAAAQDPLEILKKVAETYRNLTTYDIEQVVRSENQSLGSKSENESRQRIAGAPGRKSRHEYSGGSLTISDGQNYWNYNPASNEYTKRPGSVGGMLEYTGIAMRVKSARVLREEAVDLETAPVLCWVIEVVHDYPQPPGSDSQVERLPDTYWVDKLRFLVLKRTGRNIFKRPGMPDSESVHTTTVTKISVGQPLSDALFQFTPPESAVQVDELSFGPKSPLVGKDLPDFELADSSGNVFSTARLRGNVVILSLRSYPSSMYDDAQLFAELVHRTYKGQGVIVIGVVSENAQKAARNMPRVAGFPAVSYTFPTVVDAGGALAKTLGITGNGTVLAGRDGKIVYAISNGASSQTYREIVKVLQKNGLW